MKERLIICPIDDLVRVFKDYAGMVSIPDDAWAEKLMINPQERKLALVVGSETWDGPQPIEEIRFDLQRTFVVN